VRRGASSELHGVAARAVHPGGVSRGSLVKRVSTRLPGPTGLDWARFALQLTLDPYGGVQSLHERYGPVSLFGVGRYRYTYLLGPEANEAVLAHPERFRWREAFDPLVPIAGETALILSDGEQHQRRRRLVAPAFHRRRVDGYLDLMLRQVDGVIDRWRPGTVVNAYTDWRACIRRVIVRSLFGESLAALADELGNHLEPAFAFMNRPLLLQVRAPLPGSGWPEAVAGREAADRLIFTEIDRRRAAGASRTGTTDVLDWLLEVSDDTAGLSDTEIRDQVASLIAAGYDTTSAAAGWLVYAVCRDERVWTQLRKEVDEVVGSEPPELAHLGQMPYLAGIVSETLRLWPPVFVGGRVVVEPFELVGFPIAAGQRIAWSPYVSHRQPSLWRDPATFAPERWDPGEPGHEEPRPYAYVPFGWGQRGCLGFAFATLQLKIIAIRMLQRTELSLAVAADAVRPTGLAAVRPAGGVPVRVSTRDG
jgi:cytochrome P450